MATKKRPQFYSSKLSKAENNAVNGIIKRSWKNGKETGRKLAFRSMYAKGKF